jgi:hypothetical protein
MTKFKMPMNESEQLVQRFLDQELSGEERVRFVARLGRDESLRERVIELEQLVLDVSRLPKPALPEGFVARVMERTEVSPPIWRRWADTLFAPRSLQWNLASAAGVACVALLAVWGMVTGRIPSRPGTAAPPASVAASATAPAPSTVLVRLVVLQPGARTVQVAGDFNGWNPVQTPLEQISSGAWTVTLPLEPGRYEYMFVVDGQQWIADPFAAEQNDDGFGSRNAVLEVRPAMGTTL